MLDCSGNPRSCRLGHGPICKQQINIHAGDIETELTRNVLTSDDVVEFYAKYGQDSPVAFFFCVRTDTGLLFRPYDLTVVSREEARDDYYTISATGVMHMRKGQRAGVVKVPYSSVCMSTS